MSRSRLTYAILIPSIAGAAALGTVNTKRNTSTPVQMKATDHSDSQTTLLSSYAFLSMQLAKEAHTPAIFTAALSRQKNSLSSANILELSQLAIDNHHVTQLETLAGMFPAVITRDWVNSALLKSNSPILFSKLLRKQAAGKINHLSYLFDADNAVVLIEQADQAKLNTVALFAKKPNIILIDTDPYEPSCRKLV